MRDHDVGLERLLEVLGRFDRSGGANLEEVAWELEVEQRRVEGAWQRAQAEGLIRNGPRNRGDDGEERWRPTPGGWALLDENHRA